jgi:hypothetical protein
MPSSTHTRRAHTVTRNGKTYQRGPAQVHTTSTRAYVVGGAAMLGLGILYTTGAPVAVTVGVVGGGLAAYRYRHQLRALWGKAAPRAQERAQARWQANHQGRSQPSVRRLTQAEKDERTVKAVRAPRTSARGVTRQAVPERPNRKAQLMHLALSFITLFITRKHH